MFLTRTAFLAASVARHEVCKGTGNTGNPAEKQNISILRDDQIGVEIGAHVAVIEFGPPLAIIWSTVSVVVAKVGTVNMISSIHYVKWTY
jgi:hypothetical protein